MLKVKFSNRKFSQQSTNSLQSALDTLKSRHAATVATLTAQLASNQLELREARRQAERLRRALDSLSEDVSREGYGRRREIALRLHALGREERIVEGLRRWRRRAGESISHLGHRFPHLSTLSASPIIPPSIEDDSSEPCQVRSGDVIAAMRDTLERMIYEADDLLYSLDSLPTPNDPSGNLGGAARILLAEDTARTLLRELQRETDRRMELELHTHSIQPRKSGEGKPSRPGGHTRSMTVPSVAIAKIQDVLNVAQPSGALQATKHDGIPLLPLTNLDIPLKTLQEGNPPPPLGANTTIPGVLITEAEMQQTRETSGVTASSPNLANAQIQDEDVCAPSTLPGDTFVVNLTQSTELHHPIPISPCVPDAESIVTSLDAEPITDIHQTNINTPDAQTTPQLKPSEEESHPLLMKLQHVKYRYDEMSRAFRDCHLALQALHRDLQQTSDVPVDVSSIAILRTAVERLQDFNEDARVELEIRISDEERLMHGYTALLLLPAAIRDSNAEADAARFITGDDERVVRALASFTRKRSEVEHDVAEVKRVLHSLRAGNLEDYTPNSSPGIPTADVLPSPPTRGWPSWAGGLLPGSRPSSPAPPTFGSLMTTPRLRHSGSAASLQPNVSGSLSNRRVSTPALPFLDERSPPSFAPSQSPFTRLGLELKVSMPAEVIMPQTPGSALSSTPKPTMLRPSYSSLFRQSSMLGLGGPSRSPLMRPASGYIKTPSTATEELYNTPSPLSTPVGKANPLDSDSDEDMARDSDIE